MQISARSYLTAGVSLTAATAIAFAPLASPAARHTVTVPNILAPNILAPNVLAPNVLAPEVELTVSPADIEALVAQIQTVLDDSTSAVAGVAGIPGLGLIGVATTIETLFDVGFTGLIAATDDPALAASFAILRMLSVDAYAKLAENLGRINAVVTTTAGQVGELLTTALTGSLRNVVVALVNVVDNPLSSASYTGLLSAGVASGELLAGNGLAAVQSLGDAGFEIGGIAVDEVTFQFNNAVSRLSSLLTGLGEASGSTVVEDTVEAVQVGVIAPSVAVFNVGDLVLDRGADVADPAATTVPSPDHESARRSAATDSVVVQADTDVADEAGVVEGEDEQETTDLAAVTEDDSAADDRSDNDESLSSSVDQVRQRTTRDEAGPEDGEDSTRPAPANPERAEDLPNS